MPTLEFKGKQFIYSHHHSVPFRELVINSKKSLPASDKKPSLDDNLIIHGDNLHALKALMPQYAGKIKCIYIDPPYNTGNEGWCYNDNVNSPLMKEWISKNANPVDKEDMQRHDKWLCMMYPRLKLLHELLADDGVIFVSIDDNEQANLKLIMDEIFGVGNFVGNAIWQHSVQGKNDAQSFSVHHNYTVVYQKSAEFKLGRVLRTDENNVNYSNPDNDPKGEWRAGDVRSPNHRENLKYAVTTPSGKTIQPPEKGWRWSEELFWEKFETGEISFVADDTRVLRKIYLEEQGGKVPETLWMGVDVGTTREASNELKTIFVSAPFDTPKPTRLIQRILQIATNKNSIILDSFAGSGTTAQAVLELNQLDGGNRKFILVEMEDYADTITAERVRRVIKGVPNAKDENLKAGLDGSFTFCELGKEISIEKIITGESLPDYGALASYVFYTATGKSLDGEAKERLDYFVGETDLYEVYLIYKPDIAFLRSNESALNDSKLKAIAARNSKKEKLVFATAKYMGQKELSAQNITFCQLPYAIHKVVGA